MKKIIIIAVALSMFAAPAMAATVEAGLPVTAPDGSSLSVLSNGVAANIKSDASAFAAATKHINGPKCFASSSVSTKIYSSTEDLLALNDSDTTDFADWAAL